VLQTWWVEVGSGSATCPDQNDGSCYLCDGTGGDDEDEDEDEDGDGDLSEIDGDVDGDVDGDALHDLQLWMSGDLADEDKTDDTGAKEGTRRNSPRPKRQRNR